MKLKDAAETTLHLLTTVDLDPNGTMNGSFVDGAIRLGEHGAKRTIQVDGVRCALTLDVER